MTDLPLIALGGLLGSSHCLGMCGPFALTIGLGTRPWTSALSRQLAYSFGRIFTYSCAGTVAAYGGLRLVGRGTTFGQTQSALCVLAGVLLVIQGLSAANVLPRIRFSRGGTTSCGALLHFGGLLRSPKTSHVFLAGVATGFLPCGLVYAYLALAAA
ncbi:MAG TPA: sulfite exporter TauE/SafE family protein, partial [Planctomycetaceae bacterium]|nr:sulfite exporter TauE/SafE family protein [Planctomycetaceae bacterium]